MGFAFHMHVSVFNDRSPVSIRRCFDVHNVKRRRTDVKTTLCAYWVSLRFKEKCSCEIF